MSLEEALTRIFNEYGLLVAFLIYVAVTLWRRVVVLENKFIAALVGNTEVLTKLLERLEEHD